MMFSIGDIIDLAIQIEENGERVYRTAVDKVPNPSLASLLQWLADEEAKHIRWFSELREVANNTPIDPQVEEMGKNILRSVVGEQSFSLDEADFSRIDMVKELLRLAIEFENDTILFYEMIQTFVQDEETLDQLKQIIEEETRHIGLLEEYRAKHA
jgi:rubrerythrin